MDIIKGIVDVFKQMPVIAGAIGTLALTVVIFAVVLGVFVYQIVTAGSVSVDSTSSALITGTAGNFSAVITSVWSAVTSVTGFIVLGAIILLATYLLGRNFLGGGKGKL